MSLNIEQSPKFISLASNYEQRARARFSAHFWKSIANASQCHVDAFYEYEHLIENNLVPFTEIALCVAHKRLLEGMVKDLQEQIKAMEQLIQNLDE